MPKNKANTIELPVTMGEKYRDTVSGWEGTATAVIVYMNGCIRVETSGQDKDGKPIGYMFDQEQLVHVDAPPVERKAPALTGGDRGYDPPMR